MRKGVLDISIFMGRETLLMYAQIAVLLCKCCWPVHYSH